MQNNNPIHRNHRLENDDREQVIGGGLHQSSEQQQAQHRRRQPSPWLQKPICMAVVDVGSPLLQHNNISSTTTNYSTDSNVTDSSGDGDDRLTMGDGSSTQQQQQQHAHQALERHMSLFDLVSVGVGGTVGSGIFVLCGLISHNYAGPATCLSWLIAGIASILSGACYAELAGRIPASGSSYAYAYISMGELPAVIAAACLTLEYLVSSAAVARSWGDKVVEWLVTDLHVGDSSSDGGTSYIISFLNPGYALNPMAFLVSTAATMLLLSGVKESKSITNFFTSVKVILVLFMGIGGLTLLQPANLKPFIPPEFGIAGVFRGATSSFFGYIGYDEVCCLAGEAINPRVNLPRAIMIIIVLITVLYIFAALMLTGMEPYNEISETSGFPEAFRANNVNWAAQLCAAGEVFTMPIIVLIGVMAQPRLQFALAQDGLLPKFFSKLDRDGNLWNGTLFSGVLLVVISTCVPFTYLNDLLSAGILVAFCMTDSSVLLMRYSSPDDKPHLLEKLVAGYNALSFITALMISHSFGRTIIVISCTFTVTACILISHLCQKATYFGGARASMFFKKQGVSDDDYFRVPWLPFTPCAGIFLNWLLVAQLEALGLSLLVLYILITTVFYFLYAMKHSIGNNIGWNCVRYDKVPPNEQDDHVLLRAFSLPPLGESKNNTSSQS